MAKASLILVVLLASIFKSHAHNSHSRRANDITVMRNNCARNAYSLECTLLKLQDEDLLRRCYHVASSPATCDDIKLRYCYVWPTESICAKPTTTTARPTTTTTEEPKWDQIPTDAEGLKSRGDYCLVRQGEDKCRLLLNTLKLRYVECSKAPKTDAGCQNFKVSLCTAFPKFSPCLNGSGSQTKRRSFRFA